MYEKINLALSDPQPGLKSSFMYEKINLAWSDPQPGQPRNLVSPRNPFEAKLSHGICPKCAEKLKHE